MKRIVFLFVVACVLCSCDTLRSVTKKNPDYQYNINRYTYAYIIPTSSVTSSSGVMVGVGFGLYGNEATSVTPSEIIRGYLMQEGYTILPAIDPELVERTMIVSYGYTGRRYFNLAYASGVIIQFRDAKTHEMIVSAEAEGNGSTASNEIYNACITALNYIFNSDD